MTLQSETPLSVCANNYCKPTFTLLCDLPVKNWFAATYFCNQTNAWHLKNGNTKDWFTLINICSNKTPTNPTKYSCTQIKVGFQ